MHVMIDLETMGTRPNAPVIAIGAVKFSAMGLTGAEFYVNIDLESAVDDGHAVVDPKTVLWWMEQSGEARGALRADKKRLVTALYAFTDWLGSDELTGVWGNGASFDNVILSETYRRLNMTPPWPFWADRCYRTMKSLYKHCAPEQIGTKHNALDDARTQARHLLRIDAEFGPLL